MAKCQRSGTTIFILRKNWSRGSNGYESSKETLRQFTQILNNHPHAKALVNAFQLIHGLTGKKQEIPQDMIERYPVLEQIASSRPSAGFLF